MHPIGLLQPLHHLFTLLLLTQSRATNVPLFLLFLLQHRALRVLDLTSIEVSLTSLLLQYTSFFAFGGSNAISSIDLSHAYNGIDGYNISCVGVLTFVGNWAGPLWWMFETLVLLADDKAERTWQTLMQHLALLTTFASNSILFVMIACTALRTHLFVWTVFSPKYLYSMAWSLGQHLCINITCGTILFWLGT